MEVLNKTERKQSEKEQVESGQCLLGHRNFMAKVRQSQIEQIFEKSKFIMHNSKKYVESTRIKAKNVREKSERNANVVGRRCRKCIENQGQMMPHCERKRSKRALNEHEPQTDNVYVDYVQIKFPG